MQVCFERKVKMWLINPLWEKVNDLIGLNKYLLPLSRTLQLCNNSTVNKPNENKAI